MLYPKSPQRSDKKLNFDTFKWLFDQVKKLIQLRFDPNYFYCQQDPCGMFVTLRNPGSGAGDNPSLWKFGCTLSSTTTGTGEEAVTTWKVHVEEGWMIINGKADTDPIYISAADYDLPTGAEDGDYCYPTLNYVIATEVASIQVYSDFPTQTATDYNCPLVEYKFTKGDPPDKGSWGFETPSYICHRGNVMVNTPIVFG